MGFMTAANDERKRVHFISRPFRTIQKSTHLVKSQSAKNSFTYFRFRFLVVCAHPAVESGSARKPPKHAFHFPGGESLRPREVMHFRRHPEFDPFSMPYMLCGVVPTFESVDEILKCDRSNENY